MIRPLFILALTMTACQADETTTYDADIVWVLTALNDAPPKSQVTLTFPKQGKIAGKAPCNRYFGTQTKPYPWFETGPIASTKMACPNLNEEINYLQTLNKATSAKVTKTTLILSNDTGALLTYKRQ
tara:strand:- start:32536 stop:32916 length:381 start_codon:yes stop_codon:yes gene_type:complete